MEMLDSELICGAEEMYEPEAARVSCTSCDEEIDEGADRVELAFRTESGALQYVSFCTNICVSRDMWSASNEKGKAALTRMFVGLVLLTEEDATEDAPLHRYDMGCELDAIRLRVEELMKKLGHDGPKWTRDAYDTAFRLRNTIYREKVAVMPARVMDAGGAA